MGRNERQSCSVLSSLAKMLGSSNDQLNWVHADTDLMRYVHHCFTFSLRPNPFLSGLNARPYQAWPEA